jgi:hypothetical protein
MFLPTIQISNHFCGDASNESRPVFSETNNTICTYDRASADFCSRQNGRAVTYPTHFTNRNFFDITQRPAGWRYVQDLRSVEYTAMIVIPDVNLASQKAVISDVNTLDTGNMCQVAQRYPVADNKSRLMSLSPIRGDSLDPAEVADSYVSTDGHARAAAHFCMSADAGETYSGSEVHSNCP